MPPSINRTLVLLIPKQKFDDWENEMFPDSPIEQRDEYGSYLLEVESYVGDVKDTLKEHWEFMFEFELFSVYTNETRWPENRTWELFTEWFDIKISSVVLD